MTKTPTAAPAATGKEQQTRAAEAATMSRKGNSCNKEPKLLP